MTNPLPIRSFAIGAATGLRSMTGPAAALSGNAGLGRLLPLLALGEFIVDKVPAVPARTIAPALVVRAIGGAIAGRAVAVAAGRNVVVGALAGIAGAVGAAYAGAAYRGVATRYVPAVVAGLLEDGVAIVIARTAAKRS